MESTPSPQFVSSLLNRMEERICRLSEVMKPERGKGKCVRGIRRRRNEQCRTTFESEWWRFHAQRKMDRKGRRSDDGRRPTGKRENKCPKTAQAKSKPSSPLAKNEEKEKGGKRNSPRSKLYFLSVEIVFYLERKTQLKKPEGKQIRLKLRWPTTTTSFGKKERKPT